MAFDEDQFQTFSDQIDEILGGMAEENAESIEGSTNRMEDAMSALVDNTRSQMEELSGSVQSAMDVELVGSNVPQVNVDAGPAQGVMSQLNESLQALSQRGDITQERLLGISSLFEDFIGSMEEVRQGAVEGEVSIEEATNNIDNLTETLGQDIREKIGGELENAGEIAEQLNIIAGSAADKVTGAVNSLERASNLDMPEEEWSAALQQFGQAGSMATQLVEQSGRMRQGFQKVVEVISGPTGLVTALNVGTLGALVAIGALVGTLADGLGASMEAARGVRDEMGITRDRMQEVQALANRQSQAFRQAGLEASAAADVITTLDERFGRVQNATSAMEGDIDAITRRSANMAGRLGISAERATELQAAFTEVAHSVGGSANDAMTLAAGLSDAVGVNAQAVMEDVASSSEELSTFASGSAESIARAAVEARALGTSLDSVVDFQEQALNDITGTVQAFQQANLMAGTHLNATSLIQASYQGTKETVSELRDQVSSIGNVMEMGPLRRQALEDALGMSTAEIRRMQVAEKTLGEMGTRTQDMMDAIESGDLTFSDVLKARESSDAVEQVTREFNKLGGVFIEKLGPPLLDFAQTALPLLTDTIRFLTPFVEGLATGFKLLISPFDTLSELFGQAESDVSGFEASIGSVLGLIVGVPAAIGTATLAFRGLGSAIGSLTSTLGGAIPGMGSFFSTTVEGGEAVAEASDTISDGAGKMTSSWSKFTDAIDLRTAGAISALMLSLATSVYILSEAAQQFAEVPTDALYATAGALGAMTIAGGAIIAISSAMSASAPVIAAGAGLLIAFASGVYILASASQVFSKALQGLVPVWESFVSGLNDIQGINLFSIAGGLTALLGAFSALGYAAPLALVGAGVAATLTSSLSGLAEIAPGVESTAKAVSTLASSMAMLDKIDISGVSDELSQISNQDLGNLSVQVDTDAATPNVRGVNTGATAEGGAAGQGGAGGGEAVGLNDVVSVLKRILNDQQRLNEALARGDIGIYLNNRKVNKELSRDSVSNLVSG